MSVTPETEDLLRRHAPQVLGALVRRYGHFSFAEDAVRRPCWRRPSSGRGPVSRPTRAVG